MSNEQNDKGKFYFAIDRGGTFTDVWYRVPGAERSDCGNVTKLLSYDPANYADAPTEAIRRIMNKYDGIKEKNKDRHHKIDASRIAWIRMGTTVATNALLERQGEPTALVISAGFKDVLYIGNQSRPDIFDLEIKTGENLYCEVIEVDERVVMIREDCKLDTNPHEPVTTSTGEQVQVIRPLNLSKLTDDLEALYSRGIRSIAVVLMHSYIYPAHEEAIEVIAQRMGFTQISLSSRVTPMIKIVSRGYTATADAYLTPHIRRYVDTFAAAFTDLKETNLLFMQSNGGLTDMNHFSGSRAILSGPAGGVVGYSRTTDCKKPLIGFDMGGTSTDVSHYAGSFEQVFETTTAGITIQAPQLDIRTVAAGGGSRLNFRDGLFLVGPESVGAHPGPVCYRKGGHLAVTDANLVLGRILPEHFPHIFGPNEDLPLDKQSSLDEFRKLTDKVNKFIGPRKAKMSIQQVAFGFIEVANETMCRPIRSLTQAKGYDTANHALSCFGGAGGQHACEIARALGVGTVLVHKYAGVLSAYGMALADVVEERQTPCSLVYCKENFAKLEETIRDLSISAKKEIVKKGFAEHLIKIEPFLHLRYQGTDNNIMCTMQEFDAKIKCDLSKDSCEYGDFRLIFRQKYLGHFGFTMEDRDILVDDVRVRALGISDITERGSDKMAAAAAAEPNNNIDAKVQLPVSTSKVYFENGEQDTNIYQFGDLAPMTEISGPAIIIDKNSSILLEPSSVALVTANRDITIKVDHDMKHVNSTLNAIQLSIFSHRFMSIAEQMGKILQNTAISTNIKERLDFSCALFGSDGGLVANAPHIPVHLGAMQQAVQYQMNSLGPQIKRGDVILSNHPCAGGSHLPDLTVITPVFDGLVDEKPVFFVACRGHHSDIGGITPGSMPPNSRCLQEEGASFISFFIVRDGEFKEKELIEELMKPGKWGGESVGSRNVKNNLSDLKAQIASNQKGILLIGELIEEYSLPVVQAYMTHIQKNAEIAVRSLLKDVCKGRDNNAEGHVVLTSSDYMDDGTMIKLKVDIDPRNGSSIFDFTGTGCQVYGNCNAPKAVTLSAVIYCLRCMVGRDVPLNQGCLTPIEVIIPDGSILSPEVDAAVVGGNVLTSQRVVDTIFAAFQCCAASQGCMNNITFGDDTFGYYETVAGGSGAGPTWNGRSGVHTHMTNTRITDPEILEKRYPVILEAFRLRPNTGGEGLYHGGDGIERRLRFRRPLTLSILTERRVFRPYGLKGGESGEPGRNVLISKNGRKINLGGKSCVKLKTGDIFELLTPGGGGFGVAESSN